MGVDRECYCNKRVHLMKFGKNTEDTQKSCLIPPIGGNSRNVE